MSNSEFDIKNSEIFGSHDEGWW